jgi:uncharacterized protein YkwD
MSFTLLNFPFRAFSFQLKVGLKGATFGLVVLAAFCQAGAAQNLPAAPLARLVSEPGGELARSRPRQVSETKPLYSNAKAAPAVSPSIDDATEIERRAFDRTNEERVKSGLPKLVWDSELCRMARLHSESMGRRGFFAHETPDGLRLKERARSVGILHFRVIAENIAYNKGYDDPGAFAVERWMISSGHRANILYIGFQASAIGSYVSKDGSVYLTQVFINR